MRRGKLRGYAVMGNLSEIVMTIDSREKSAYRLFDENLAARGPAS
jgi:hypothetical protein